MIFDANRVARIHTERESELKGNREKSALKDDDDDDDDSSKSISMLKSVIGKGGEGGSMASRKSPPRYRWVDGWMDGWHASPNDEYVCVHGKGEEGGTKITIIRAAIQPFFLPGKGQASQLLSNP